MKKHVADAFDCTSVLNSYLFDVAYAFKLANVVKMFQLANGHCITAVESPKNTPRQTSLSLVAVNLLKCLIE